MTPTLPDNKAIKPKHKKAHFFINKGLFANLSSFSELETRISNLPKTERGNAFEVFAEAYFNTKGLHQAQEVWPEKDLPESLREKLGIATDAGVDGVIKTSTGLYKAYQVKFRSNRPALTWDNDRLGNFFGQTDRVDGRILFTNSNDLSHITETRTDFYSVRGNDLDRLDHSDFQEIENFLKVIPFVQEKKSPWPHQKEAINDILNEFKEKDRTIAHMACASGKTLVAMWVAEKMNIQNILVLLPSLALVRQTLHDWDKENRWDKFNPLCVCSDVTVTKGEDEIILKRHELDFPVTTDENKIESFIQNQNFSQKIIFSTYQSCKEVAKAMPHGFSFDLAIFDEAHKTAGREGTNFTYALKDENISITKRLFLTATPRHVNVNKKDKEGNSKPVFSMDNPAVYGRICHKLSFADAAKQKIICKYKIVISVVSEEVDRELLKHGIVNIKDDPIKAQRAANLLALTNAVKRYGVKRIFTFHNSVKAAKSFTSNSSEGISTFLDSFDLFHVSGEMTTSKRDQRIKKFGKAPKAIMSNARCLTEGVDLPAVDMVAFISPKRSQIDIIQATGRAMRKSEGKEYGYILIPIFLELASGENLEQAFEKTQFDDIWNVLQTLQEHDESLFEIISQMREDIGRTGGFDDSRLREKIEFLAPEVQLLVLKNAITTKIVEKLGSTWDERFGELCKFKEKNRDCNVPKDYAKNPSLGIWVDGQRGKYKNKKLSSDKIKKLEGIEFNWDPNGTRWEKGFAKLCEYKNTHDDCMVPSTYKDKTLATWVTRQRTLYNQDKLSPKCINLLINIGFVFEPDDAAWQEQFSRLCQFKEVNNNANVPQKYPKDLELGRWVTTQRAQFKKENLSQERIKKLNSIGFDWMLENIRKEKVLSWEEMFAKLRESKKVANNCNDSNTCKDKKIARWINRQRTKYRNNYLSREQINKKENLSQEHIDKLNSIEFDWMLENRRKEKALSWEEMRSNLRESKHENNDSNTPNTYKDQTLARWENRQRTKYKNNDLSREQFNKLKEIDFVFEPVNDIAWNNKFNELQKFKNLNGHLNIPWNSNLNKWTTKQRAKYKNSKLSPSQISRLKEIGFNFEPVGKKWSDKWNDKFIELCKFKATEGHCNVSKDNPANPSLGTWVDKQRCKFKNKNLSLDKIKRLEEIKFDWDPIKSTWEEQFSELQKYKNKFGKCNVPRGYIDNPSLANWVNRQRSEYVNGKLPQELIKRLNDIGFVFEPDEAAWEKMFTELCKFKESNGSCLVAQKYPNLGRWVSMQRTDYKKGNLSQARFERLNELGFVWKIKDHVKSRPWDEWLADLCKFKDMHGNFKILQNNENNIKLSRWANKQRSKCKNKQISNERMKKLQSIGFIG